MSDLESIQTQRLHLRPLTVKDAPALYAAVNDFDVIKMTATWKWPIDEAFVRGCLVKWQKGRGKTQLGFGVFVDDVLIGDMGGGIEVHRENGQEVIFIGYMIGKKWWGRGYVTEAVKTLCPLLWSRLGPYDIYAEHFFDNPASGRVLEKCGFRHIGAAPLQWCEARQKKIPGEQFMLKAESAL